MTNLLLFGGLLLVNIGTLVMIKYAFNGGEDE
jgi:hypothetical protein